MPVGLVPDDVPCDIGEYEVGFEVRILSEDLEEANAVYYPRGP
jgi:hypothetical protein